MTGSWEMVFDPLRTTVAHFCESFCPEGGHFEILTALIATPWRLLRARCCVAKRAPPPNADECEI